jgi:uncharacterized membrane protein YbhN (UPF0104 family)
MTRFTYRLIAAMLLGVAVYGFATIYVGVAKIEQSLSRFEGSAFALALALATSNYAFRFLKWQYYLGRLGVRGIPALDSLLVFLSGFVLTITPGKVGEVFKSAVLARTHGVPAHRTAPIVVADRLTDAISIIILIVAGGAALTQDWMWAGAGTVAVLLGLALIAWPAPGRWLVGRLTIGPERFRRFAPKLEEALAGLRRIASPSALLWPTALSVVAWGAEGVALFVLLQGFGATVPLGVAVFFYSTATLAGALVPVPGGLGVVEGLIQKQLVGLGGVQDGPATAAMMLVRLATLWWAVFIGFAALFVLRLRFPAELKGDVDVNAETP